MSFIWERNWPFCPQLAKKCHLLVATNEIVLPVVYATVFITLVLPVAYATAKIMKKKKSLATVFITLKKIPKVNYSSFWKYFSEFAWFYIDVEIVRKRAHCWRQIWWMIQCRIGSEMHGRQTFTEILRNIFRKSPSAGFKTKLELTLSLIQLLIERLDLKSWQMFPILAVTQFAKYF